MDRWALHAREGTLDGPSVLNALVSEFCMRGKGRLLHACTPRLSHATVSDAAADQKQLTRSISDTRLV